MKYKIQHKIATLNENAINAHKGQPHFRLENIDFTHWKFNHRDGWLEDAWLAEAEIEAPDVFSALKIFGAKIDEIIPKVAFVGQVYTEQYHQPALAVKESSDIAYFYDPFESEAVGLMFMQEELEALEYLMQADIPKSFFKYWNDAVNTIGYAPKLLILFSAIVAFAKKPNGNTNWELVEEILGKDLKDAIFRRKTGLRHRLVHGDYFIKDDSKTNYVIDIHQAFIRYFNKQIFKKDLLSEDITHPQRHIFGNKSVEEYFIKAITPRAKLDLREVLADFNADKKDHRPTKYTYVFDDDINSY